MTIITKLFLKLTSTVSIFTNFSLAQKLSIYQNPTLEDCINPINKLNSAFDNTNKKTNIIVNSFYNKRL